MGQRNSRVFPVNGEVYDCHHSTPPKPGTDTAEQHLHPCDEEVVRSEEVEVRREEERREAWSEVEEEKKKKRKKRFWRLPSFLRAARKHLNMIRRGQTEVQLIEPTSPASSTDDDIMSRYELGDRLGVGGFGVVYEARRVEDGLKVAVKDVMKTNDMEYLNIPDHPNPLPLEIALTFLANKGPTAPGIIKLLDWQDQRDNYVMVLECPSPCENLASFLEGHGDRLNEGLVRHIMRQATQAARTSCRRGVFHGDVKLENFIVSKNTLEVKLIDFGCGDLMRKSAYTTLYGTMEYYPPEYRIKGKYHGESAMSWSLGVILFTMLCGRFPTGEDLQKTKLNLWSEPGLSEDCCRLVCSLLQPKPKRRLRLGEILCHDWFKVSI